MAVKPHDARITRAGGGLTADREGVRLPPREDARLVDALRARAPGAFAELVADYQNAVFSLALRLVRDREDARDITQDVLIKAHESIPRIEGELHLWAWLYRVTVNMCWDHLRAASRRPEPAEDAEQLAAARPADDAERAEVARLFSQSLAALPPRQQAALLLKDVHGLGHADIAEALGISKGSSKVLLFHARHSFRRAYKALVADGPLPATCHMAERFVAASVGGRLSAAQRRAILRHARSCADCRSVVAGWQGPHAVGLALALPMVAAPHLFAAPSSAPGAFGPALAGAGASAVAGVSAAAGAGASAGATAGAITAGGAAAGATTGATLGAAGGIAAKLAGLGVTKAAAVVLAAGSVAAYGGAEAYTTGAAQPHRPQTASAASPADARPPRAGTRSPQTFASAVTAATLDGAHVRPREVPSDRIRVERQVKASRDWLKRHIGASRVWLTRQVRAPRARIVARAWLREARHPGLDDRPLQDVAAKPAGLRPGGSRGRLPTSPAVAVADHARPRATARAEKVRVIWAAAAAHGSVAGPGWRPPRPAGKGYRSREPGPATAHPARVVNTLAGTGGPRAAAAAASRPAKLQARAQPVARPAKLQVRARPYARTAGKPDVLERAAARLSSNGPHRGASPRKQSQPQKPVTPHVDRKQPKPVDTRGA